MKQPMYLEFIRNKSIGVNMFTIKELQKRLPDLIGNICVENGVTVVEIPHGRIKIMPEHRKPGK